MTARRVISSLIVTCGLSALFAGATFNPIDETKAEAVAGEETQAKSGSSCSYIGLVSRMSLDTELALANDTYNEEAGYFLDITFYQNEEEKLNTGKIPPGMEADFLPSVYLDEGETLVIEQAYLEVHDQYLPVGAPVQQTVTFYKEENK